MIQIVTLILNNISLNLISSLSILIPLAIMIVGGIKWVRPSIPLFLIILLSAITETMCLIIKENNLHIINVHNILEMTLIGWLYIDLLRNRYLKDIIATILLLVIVFSVVNIVYIQGLFKMNSYFLLSKSFLIIVISVSLLAELLSNLSDGVSIFKTPEFWISSGFLIYWGGNVFVFAYSFEYLVTDSKFSFNIWHIHSIFNIILSLHLAKAILLIQKNKWIKE